MFFTPKPNPTAPQSLFYQQSQTPQKPFTQKLIHQTPPQTTPQNISVFLTPSPETSEPSSQNPHLLLPFLPSLQPNANKPQRGKEEEASQSASNRPLSSSSSSLCPDLENATNKSNACRRQPQTKRSFFRRRRRRPSSQSEREERDLTESERQKTEARRERETCQGLFH
jgi:hypothetical protein